MRKKFYIFTTILLFVSLVLTFIDSPIKEYIGSNNILTVRLLLIILFSLGLNLFRSVRFLELGIKKVSENQAFKFNFITIYKAEDSENIIMFENAPLWLESRIQNLQNIDEAFIALKKDVCKIIEKNKIINKYLIDKRVELILKDLKDGRICRREFLEIKNNGA